MPIAVTVPSVTNDPTKTILPQHLYITILPSGGSAVSFKPKTASLSTSVTKVERKVATVGGGGTVVRDRTVVTEVTRTLKFTLDEYSTDVATLLSTPNLAGTARLWVKDPADAANTAAMLTNEFSMTCTQEGDMNLDSSNFTEVQFTMDVLGTFTLSFDASTTV